MGLACLVFPGANHTRFEHSLGVMHVADVLGRNLLEASDDGLDENRIQEIRLAALLHDVGHTPFSHVVEEFFKRYPKYVPKAERYDHEQYAIKIINDSKIKETCEDVSIDLSFVSKLAVGKSGTYLDPLISSCLDADKIDYIIRDSYYCGLPYGNVDLFSLSEGIRLTELDQDDKCISFDESSRDAAEGLLTSRFYLMTTVHLHERNCAANLLLFKAIAEAYDYILQLTADSDQESVLGFLARDMHFTWVDHDLITFLKDPLEPLRLSALRSVKGSDKSITSVLESLSNKMSQERKECRSSLLLDRVLTSRVPAASLSYPLTYFSPAARYGLYLV